MREQRIIRNEKLAEHYTKAVLDSGLTVLIYEMPQKDSVLSEAMTDMVPARDDSNFGTEADASGAFGGFVYRCPIISKILCYFCKSVK